MLTRLIRRGAPGTPESQGGSATPPNAEQLAGSAPAPVAGGDEPQAAASSLGGPDPRLGGRVPDLVPDLAAGRPKEASRPEREESVSSRMLRKYWPDGNPYRSLSKEECPQRHPAIRCAAIAAALLVAVLAGVGLSQLCRGHSGGGGGGGPMVPEQDRLHAAFGGQPAGSWAPPVADVPGEGSASPLRAGGIVQAHFHVPSAAHGAKSTFADTGVIVSPGTRDVEVQFENVGEQVIPADWIVAVLPGTGTATHTRTATTTTRLNRTTSPQAPHPALRSQPKSTTAPPAPTSTATDRRTTSSKAAATTTTVPPTTKPPPQASSTTRRPTSTSTSAPRAKGLLGGPHGTVTLYCFSVMMASGNELSLVRTQLAQGAGVFACDDYTVFSDEKTWLTPGPPVRIDSEAIDVNLTAQWDGVSTHYKNTGQFIKVWEAVKHDGKFLSCDWVVKVDPDAVFFPDRLRKRVHGIVPSGNAGAFLLNCKGYGSVWMFGALEVISRAAVEAYFAGVDRCEEELQWWTLGEDTYLSKCLDLLGAERVEAFDTLLDAYCNQAPAPCASTAAVAFHPFKTPEGYFDCWASAKRASEAQPAQPVLFH